ncbi:GNAT family N-acetyltransferase [Cohnella herbarum]|uniref:GNAT family N-acetyltransferase n=1 Tax=Cohnella herbarum TaxID=2728023 RepID=A0A7Z2VQB7_9BACL|nr:GNAT family N-acetyltransferase [Cohnella herbarum]QJD87294.1 GNAT family N-acetyltransferase [Cohnella herbarum]
MAEIRFVEEKEIGSAAALADLVFRDEEQTSMGVAFPFIFSGNFGSSVGAFEDGKLAAFMGLVPSELQIGKAVLPLFSMGAVCTHPDYRGRGYAGDMLKLAFEHIAASGASLLYVSGDRSLYRRHGCHRFGSVRNYSIKPGQFMETEQAGSASYRKFRESDRFRLQALADDAFARYRRGLYETALLIRSESLASISKLRNETYVAESEGSIAAYAVVAMPAEHPTQSSPFVVEWGGDAVKAAQLLSFIQESRGLSELRVAVPFHDSDMQEALQRVPYTEGTNTGTVKIIDPKRLLTQLAPYLKEKNNEVAPRITLDNVKGEEGAAELRIDDNSIRLTSEELVSVLFDLDPDVAAIAQYREMLGKLFPIPLPYAAGLNFV